MDGSEQGKSISFYLGRKIYEQKEGEIYPTQGTINTSDVL